MNRKWISSIVMGIFVSAISVPPCAARLSPGNFLPFSEAVSSIADQQVKTYRIVKGDTLNRIARTYDVSLQNLMLSNNLDEDSILNVGDILTIPSSLGDVHVIVRGDTLSCLADQYQVSIESMIEANPEIDPNYLEVGKSIKIPEAQDSSQESSTEVSRSLSSTALMSWPITGTITSPYGMRKSGFHHGLDIANDKGTTIHAAADGTVSFAGSMAIYGRTIIIDHPDGIQTLYAHTQNILVQKGAKVSRGQAIAEVGMSGVTTGPHLHFEVRYKNKTRNPITYLR